MLKYICEAIVIVFSKERPWTVKCSVERSGMVEVSEIDFGLFEVLKNRP